MPGMLFGDFVRSPYGHARIKSIDAESEKALAGVAAVLTAEDLKPPNLHYMPTLAGDVQAVLADGKVLFQGQEIAYDELGNVTDGSLIDDFLPTTVETPAWETDFTVTPSPHHPIGAKGVGESPNVGGVSAFSNAVNDAFAHLGLTHTAMPHDHRRVWKTAERLGLTG